MEKLTHKLNHFSNNNIDIRKIICFRKGNESFDQINQLLLNLLVIGSLSLLNTKKKLVRGVTSNPSLEEKEDVQEPLDNRNFTVKYAPKILINRGVPIPCFIGFSPGPSLHSISFNLKGTYHCFRMRKHTRDLIKLYKADYSEIQRGKM